MNADAEKGATLIELLVSLAILLVCATGLAQMTIENSRVNRAQQMTAQAQANARNSMALIVQQLRSAGWDPLNAGIPNVAWDSNPSDGISEIEVFADIDGDGLTDADGEQILIRHVGDRIVWRRSNDTTAPFVILATNISNDADGDGTVEDMFTPLLATGPEGDRILVQITAESPAPDPLTGDSIRYTVRSEVALRKTL